MSQTFKEERKRRLEFFQMRLWVKAGAQIDLMQNFCKGYKPKIKCLPDLSGLD